MWRGGRRYRLTLHQEDGGDRYFADRGSHPSMRRDGSEDGYWTVNTENAKLWTKDELEGEPTIGKLPKKPRSNNQMFLEEVTE